MTKLRQTVLVRGMLAAGTLSTLVAVAGAGKKW